MELITTRIAEETLKLSDGKTVPVKDLLVSKTETTDGVTSGKVTIIGKKAARERWGLKPSQAAWLVNEAGKRLKQAESAAFAALASRDNTVGLGMRQTASGAVWFGVKEAKPVKSTGKSKLELEQEATLSAQAAELATLKATLAALAARANVDVASLLPPPATPAA